MTKLRIFIACADERLRLALLLFLEQEPGIFVVGIIDRLPGLLIHLEAAQPDVLLMQWDIPIQSLEDLFADIHNMECPPKVILLSNKPEEREKILSAGADHFIAKDAPPDELLPILSSICFPGV